MFKRSVTEPKLFQRQLAIGIGIMLVIFGLRMVYDHFVEPSVRIIAIGQDITSTVYALKAEGDLIGVDDSSVMPPSVSRKPMIGHFGEITADTLLQLNPTHVVMLTDGMAHKEIIKLQEEGVAVSVLPLMTEKQILDMIQAVAEITHREEKAIDIMEAVQEKYSILLSALRAVETSPPEILVLSKVGETSLIAWGQDTQADALLKQLKASNAVKVSGQIPWRTDLLQSPPTALLFLTQQDKPAAEEDKALAVLLGLSPQKVLTLPQSQAFNLGPNFVDVWIRLANFIHPELGVEVEAR